MAATFTGSSSSAMSCICRQGLSRASMKRSIASRVLADKKQHLSTTSSSRASHPETTTTPTTTATATSSLLSPQKDEGSEMVNSAEARQAGLSDASTQAAAGASSDGISAEELAILERRRRMALMNSLEAVGSSQTRNNTFQPHHTLSRSQTPSSVTLSHLLASTAHLGHSTSLSSPFAFPYIYGKRHGISIIDARETLVALRRASALVRATIEKDGIVLFIGTKEMDRILIKNVDEKLGENGYATTKWLPGTITNSTKIYAQSTNLLVEQQQQQQQNSSAGDGRRGAPGGSINPTHLQPSLLVLLSPLKTPHALREANAFNIPTIALCDTNVDPRHFTYPIPCNDDSLRVIELITGVLAEAGKEGLSRKNQRLRLLQSQASTRDLAIQKEYERQSRNDAKFRRRQRE